jgi:hypothetical protein
MDCLKIYFDVVSRPRDLLSVFEFCCGSSQSHRVSVHYRWQKSTKRVNQEEFDRIRAPSLFLIREYPAFGKEEEEEGSELKKKLW